MNVLNAILTWLTDVIWLPMLVFPGLLTLIVWAAVAGVLAGLFFRHTSNQAALQAVADRIRANLLAMRLFKEELGVTLRCQLELFKAAGLRFWYALPAFAAMLIPFVLLLIQLALRFEYRPLEPGEAAIVELHLAPTAWDQFENASLTVPPGVIVETPALHVPPENTVYWRIRPQEAGSAKLRWQLGDQVIEKTLETAEKGARLRVVDPRRPGRGIWDRLLHPAEPALPANSPAQALVVRYPPRHTPVFGLDVPWWLTFLVASILIAFLLRPVLKVRF